jgi:TPR repeat protein
MEEYQAWIEEFIYKFSKAVTNGSSGSKYPINDYGVIASFLDIINTNSLDTSNIRGLENKSAFEQTFSKAQNLFNELAKTPEVQEHLRQQENARREQERQQELARVKREQLEQQKADIAAEARAQVKKFVVVAGALFIGLVLVSNYMEYKSSAAEEEKRQAQAKIDIQGATDGDADAQYRVGEMYYDGKGVSMNYCEALKWYQKAADQGDESAKAALLKFQ